MVLEAPAGNEGKRAGILLIRRQQQQKKVQDFDSFWTVGPRISGCSPRISGQFTANLW